MNAVKHEEIEGLGVRLHRLRRQRKWSFLELEKRTGVARSHLYAIEMGRVKNPNALTVIRIAKGFEMSLDTLLDFHPQIKALCPACGGEGWVFTDVLVA